MQTNRHWDWCTRYQHLQRQRHSPSSLSYRQQLIADLLYCDISIETDRPPLGRHGCFVMFKRTIYCSRVNPRSHLFDRQSDGEGGICGRVFPMRDSRTSGLWSLASSRHSPDCARCCLSVWAQRFVRLKPGLYSISVSQQQLRSLSRVLRGATYVA